MSNERFDMNTKTDSKVTIDKGLRNHFMRVYNIMAFGLVVTGLTAFMTSQSEMMVKALIAMQSNMMLSMLVAFSPMIIVMMAFNPMTMRKLSSNALTFIFLGFSAYFGWLFSTMFLAYTGSSIARVFFITSATFAAMSIYGYTTRRDLSSMRSFFMMGIIGLFIAIVANMFFQSSMLQLAISAIGVILYTLLVAFNTQDIKRAYNEAYGEENNRKFAVVGALNLYINFIMLFQFLMQFMGDRR